MNEDQCLSTELLVGGGECAEVVCEALAIGEARVERRAQTLELCLCAVRVRARGALVGLHALRAEHWRECERERSGSRRSGGGSVQFRVRRSAAGGSGGRGAQ